MKVQPSCSRSAPARASRMRSNCANCAQEVRSSVRTVGTHLGAYQQQGRTEVRNHQGANQAACYQKNMVARRWFPLWFPGFGRGFHWQPSQHQNTPAAWASQTGLPICETPHAVASRCSNSATFEQQINQTGNGNAIHGSSASGRGSGFSSTGAER